MPRIPKTLLDEASQLMRIKSNAGKRVSMKGREFRDMNDRYFYDLPSFERESDYRFMDNRDAAMNSYMNAKRRYDMIANRNREVENAVNRWHTERMNRKRYLDNLIRERNKLIEDSYRTSYDPESYYERSRYYATEIPEAERLFGEVDEVPPAGWRGF